MTQLEIDECIDWIKHCIDFVHEFRYNYVATEVWEFLVFEAREHYMDVTSLTKIEKTTGMTLVHIRSFKGIAELWFSRRLRTRNIGYIQQKNSNNNLHISP